MKIMIDGIEYNVIIDKKRTTKNTYIRVKDNLDIYITSNIFTPDRFLINLLNNNIDSVKKMINRVNKKLDKEKYFYYLGKRYDIVSLNIKGITIGEDKVFVDETFDIDKFLKKEALKIFKEELDIVYNRYIYDIPYPSLVIRKMKTRWGVNNRGNNTITLNTELIKKDVTLIDYVCVHELCHFLEANHSEKFWYQVSLRYPYYKRARKMLREV